jgi:thiol-disulfide isomerase/thioredoxin
MAIRTAVLALVGCAAFTGMAGEPAKPSPPLTIQRAGSPAIQLSQYRGKIVLLAFIHTTCPHCQELTRGLIPIARDYQARGVQVVECAFNTNADQLVPGFVQQFQPPFPVGWAANDTVMGYLGRSVMDTTPFFVPHLVFLDRRGMIQGDFAGESDFMKTPDPSIRGELDKLLKAGAPAAGK